MIRAREEALEHVSYIHYPVQFKDMDKTSVQTLINSESEVNIIYPSFANQLGLLIKPIDVRAQKIYGTMLDTHEIIVAAFLIVDKANQIRFFEETFLVANVSLEIVFGILFLTLSSTGIDFLGQELWWRTYTTKEALSTTRRIKLVGKKEFAAAALNPEHEIYIIYIASLKSTPLTSLRSTLLNVYPFRRPQISGLIVKEALIKVPAKYSDFADVFSSDLTSKLPKQSRINNYAIELVKSYQQLSFGPIYSLGLVELETLKAYIETNLVNRFIRSFKSPVGAPILFDRKSDGFLLLCVNYWGLNNLTIKNRYPLPLIEKSLDKLRRARWFTQLDLTSTYHQMRIRKGDKWKPVFKTWYGHFAYQMMPFGLTNAPASFQG